MSNLSPKRKRILDFIAGFIREKDYPPSVRDIVKGCGISSTTVVQYYLNVLERDGYIRRNRGTSRSISLIKRKVGLMTVPLMGTIAAGEPIPIPSSDTWDTAPEEEVDIPRELAQGKKEVYALRVKGASMIDALIDDGDIVLMQHTNTAEDGEMVAVWLKDQEEATLKRIYRESGRIRLQPANSQVKPLYQDPENVEVQGKVIGVIRKIELAD
jgi:repressor LexA